MAPEGRPTSKLDIQYPQSLRHFNFSIFCFHLTVTRSMVLPAYKGSTFHGGFGRALNCIGSRFRDLFYNPTPPESPSPGKRSMPKPFMLIPPLSEKERYQPGDQMECRLILYGKMIDHFMVAFAALEMLGNRLGLGRDEGKYRIDEVIQISADGPVTVFSGDHWSAIPEPLTAYDVFNQNDGKAAQTTLLLTTRLRLKYNNHLVRQPPEFEIFFDRLLGRMNSLSVFYNAGMLIDPAAKRDLLGKARSIRIDQDKTNARWSDWSRPTGRGKKEMTFGGLLGGITYRGELKPFLPWLALGQWTGIGGKTSFGLGHYQMEIES